ncbi:hypothetical protein FB45DRAFT_109037 [Roridomyces roridus]|uniref:HNH nuclease domain-containing protein n=1 Tax=Roridomyces roridus TaxID=1738132 RepID=A0AAD7BK56_9AGAR|nr:hypothetical protein FB45DRAFT_109037 [Roridomyces roridus]
MSHPTLVSLAPLPPTNAPYRYEWKSGRLNDNASDITAFSTSLDTRDEIPKIGRGCIVCGEKPIEHAHIMPESDKELWDELRDRGYVPPEAKPVHTEPRNGMTLCPNHRKNFDGYKAFVRYVDQVRVPK